MGVVFTSDTAAWVNTDRYVRSGCPMSSIEPKRYDAFLSYNSQDRAAVREVAGRLQNAGLTPYLELWEVTPGREFQPALAEGLNQSKTCAVFLGPNGLGPWQKQELQVALDKRARDEAFRVIPVLLPGAERPRRGDVAHLDFLINASCARLPDGVRRPFRLPERPAAPQSRRSGDARKPGPAVSGFPDGT